jgi:flagellar export protein FliJ
MNSFRFRLDSVLRWRQTELKLQEARLSAATKRVGELQAALGGIQSALDTAHVRLRDGAEGQALQSYGAFRSVATAHMRDCERRIAEARQAVAEETGRMLEATRKVRLLEKLRDTQHLEWRRGFDKELAAFADEAFLARSRP